ncbi:MAG TPA: alginate export family protein [Terracidiphilus sp.]|nr:alginate export family protein [Terracidiphilus sp.]
MPLIRRAAIAVALLLILAAASLSRAQKPGKLPVSLFANQRTRINAWQWFAAPPANNSYGYVESLLRFGVAQRIRHWDWLLELSQPAVFDVPDSAISSVPAQGQLGLGGTYYAASKDQYPSAAFLKQAFVRYHFSGPDKTVRIGRFEFLDGVETKPENSTIAWLQANRMQQRLIGNFGFANAQRSIDGIDAHYGQGAWDVTAAAGRVDHGVFNMNGNEELDVDFQYLAFTRADANNHILWRAFGAGYHDGRTGLTKTDNRFAAARAADHQNIRIGSYGASLMAAAPAGPGQFDLLLWGTVQDGRWGLLDHRADAVAAEGGYKFGNHSYSPWLRGGWFRSSGDGNNADGTHKTFFGVLPTPRAFARMPFYNLMNNTDGFVQIIDKPVKRVALRSDLHWVKLTSAGDLWYQGGGAFDNKVFGFVGRPSNGHRGLSTVADISADLSVTKSLDVGLYYAHATGKAVVSAIYPTGQNAQYGFVEFDYHWGLGQKPAH